MKVKRRPSCILMMIVVMISMSRAEEVSPSQCQEELQQGINGCIGVVMGQQPSPACCAFVRVTHLECVCPKVTPAIAAMINPKQIRKIAEGCGRKLPSHLKCGSKLSLYK